jgi:beta-glucosidase
LLSNFVRRASVDVRLGLRIKCRRLQWHALMAGKGAEQADPFMRNTRRNGHHGFCLIAILSLLIGQALAQTDLSRTTDTDSRVESILGRMTLEEKIDLLGGVDGFFIRGVPRLGVPRFKMADGPVGVRNFGPATSMAGGIALSATWNPALAERVGKEIGRDARAKGVHFLLGPGVNIYRAPMNGRNFEYFGEDPFLASRIAVGYIRGVQGQGVSATVKHFMGNNSEFDRHNTDSVIDERTMREIYLPVFEAAVKEGHVGAIMDSYNLVNGAHATQNGFLNVDVLKKEWGFKGMVMSDWTSTYDAVAAANAGLDLEMPSGVFMNQKNLLPAIEQGKVSLATVDDKVRRILRTAIAFGWLDRDQTDILIPRYNVEGRHVALQAARESMVLLKNEGPLLPLSKHDIKSVAVIGPEAYPAVPVGGGSARVQPFAAVSFLEALSNYLGADVPVYYNSGVPSLSEMADVTNFSTAATGGQPGIRVEYFTNATLEGNPSEEHIEQHINVGRGSNVAFPEHSRSDRWTGYFRPQDAGLYDLFVESTGEDGGSYRVFVDDKPVFDDWTTNKALMDSASLQLDATPHKVVLEHHGRSGWLGTRLRMGIVRHDGVVNPEAKLLAAKADAVIVAVGFDPETESEGADRTFNLPPGQDQLIREITAANRNTIVVITAGGAVNMQPWLDHVPAAFQVWYPGQEGGTALAELLFGEVNPSGRLPVSFERRWDDNPTHDSYYPPAGTKRVVYQEGLFVGYRGFDRNGTKPLFPFGYGLSYTTFAYRKLSISGPSRNKPSSWQVQVQFDLTNTGKREGAEVAQVYVGSKNSPVPRPAKELKGFEKVNLRPGETRRVTVTLDRRAFSFYDVATKQWRADAGEYEIFVGRSEGAIELQGKVTLSGAATAGGSVP